MLKLSKPIVFFDLETTGTSIQQDRIVQIAVIKMFPDPETSIERKVHLIDPGCPIPSEATEIHGITDEMVQGKPKFIQIAKGVKDYMTGCDLGGYNSDMFDIPMLIQEFHRCNIAFPDWDLNVIDVIKIERILNSHKLSETYKRYFDKELDDAHDAMVDANATVDIFFEQLDFLKDQPDFNMSIEAIDKFCQGENERFDLAGKCYLKDGVVHWSFGKNMNKPVLKDTSYLNWVLNSDFPIQTKNLLNEYWNQNK